MDAQIVKIMQRVKNNMKYELAKQLKDAGFRQVWPDGKGELYIGEKKEDGMNEGVYIPTLSELIEACGNDFKSLIQHDVLNDLSMGFIRAHGKFSASMHHRNPEVWKNTMFGGHSPEEAVAKLWLSLNMK